MRKISIKKYGISAAKLKIIAMICMVIDHIAATSVWNVHAKTITNAFGVFFPGITTEFLYNLFRSIGRISWPIFCFLLVEGWNHTKHKGKYALRTAIFAMISQIPYNLVHTRPVLYIGSPNILFTILIGMLFLEILYRLRQKLPVGMFVILLFTIIALVFSEVGILLNLDYGSQAFVMMLMFYFAKEFWKPGILFATAFYKFPSRFLGALTSCILLLFYNGERGEQNKWIFYIFYPAHLWVLYFFMLV